MLRCAQHDRLGDVYSVKLRPQERAHLDTVDVSRSRSDGFGRDASVSRGSGVPAAMGSNSRGGDASPTSFGLRNSP
jgi:hypothetical protein